MHIVKLLAGVLLALYLIIVGLEGLGFVLAFLPHTLVGLLALVAGILLLVLVIKAFTCCESCEKH